jgi:hypothetical protein
VDVEVNLYSGRPNPRFPLTNDDVTDILGRLAALPPTTHAPPATALGYRGLILTDDTARGPFARVEVSRGLVVAQDHHGDRHRFLDPDRALERHLVALADRHLEASAVENIRRELGSAGPEGT